MSNPLGVAIDDPFGVDALAYGSFSVKSDESFGSDQSAGRRRIGVRIGAFVLDLGALAREWQTPWAGLVSGPVLNPLMGAGPSTWTAVRAELQARLNDPAEAGALARNAWPLESVTLHLAFEVADYVDFYSSIHHATNVGRIFRPGSEPLPVQWKDMPIGYHGRAGTIVVSGTPVRRPNGQRRGSPGGGPSFGPTEQLDIEAEVGFVVGVASELGESIGVADFDAHVFGVVLLNDWSARDIQSWEYVPLGPFLGKSFCTSVSAWVLPLAALDAARIAPPARDAAILPYLADQQPAGFDLSITVALNGESISFPPFASMYWTAAQQLAHLTVNGAAVRTGDLYASGTVSGPETHQRGSLLELSWAATQPLILSDGTSRTYLQDGDEVRLTATAPGPRGYRIGLGEVVGRVAAARRA